MKLFSWNVNGIRAVARTTFLPWFESERADIVCLQETKAQPELSPGQLSEEILHPLGYHSLWHSAQKPGYSGLGVYSRKEPLRVKQGIGIPEIDREGRVLTLEFKDFFLINSYFPNSQRDHARLGYKLSFCREILDYCNRLRGEGKTVVICGDFNIAHKEIDLKNPKSNEKNAGFLPEERACMDEILSAGWTDAFRHFTKDPGHYTWWSYRPGVREKNIGWRLDYFLVNSESEDRLGVARHHPTVLGSDHCPVELELRS